MYCVTPIASPRNAGSIPASRSTRSAASADPAQEASAARSVLRRWANAASITAKTVRWRSGWPRRRHRPDHGNDVDLVNSTSAESTFGTGQNTVLEIVPTRRAFPYQAILTDGTP